MEDKFYLGVENVPEEMLYIFGEDNKFYDISSNVKPEQLYIFTEADATEIKSTLCNFDLNSLNLSYINIPVENITWGKDVTHVRM